MNDTSTYKTKLNFTSTGKRISKTYVHGTLVFETFSKSVSWQDKM